MTSKYVLASLFGLALAIAGESLAQADDTQPAASRSEVVGLTALSGTLAVAGFALPVPASYVGAFQLSASAPILAASDVDAALNGSAQAAFFGSSVGLGLVRRHDDTWTPYATFAGELSLHQALYATYATYRDLRTRGPGDGTAFQPVRGVDLVVAPLHAASYEHRIVFAPLVIEAALAGIVGAVSLGNGSARWNGPHFARDLPLGLLVSWDAGVTEEAFDRGVVYEELKTALPRWPARVIDMAFFAGLHVPGELHTQSPSQIVGGIGVRALFALCADVAYDEGGLRESIALHVADDSILFMLAAVTGGSPLGNSVSPMLGPIGKTGRPGGQPVLFPLWSSRF